MLLWHLKHLKIYYGMILFGAEPTKDCVIHNTCVALQGVPVFFVGKRAAFLEPNIVCRGQEIWNTTDKVVAQFTVQGNTDVSGEGVGGVCMLHGYAHMLQILMGFSALYGCYMWILLPTTAMEVLGRKGAGCVTDA